jgi:hypothetical protein
MKLLNPLDLSQNDLRNAVAHVLAAAPASPVPGQFYYNSSLKLVLVWNGAAWRSTDAAGLADGSIPNTALTTNPLARANHTGTQLAATINDLATVVKAYKLSDFAAPTAPVSMGSQRITGVATPSAGTDATTKDYVDTAVQSAAAGIDSKPSVRVIALTNITLSGLQTIDGVTVASGDRVLVAGQTTAATNGVYVAASGVWSRATDADQTGEINPGAFWFVEQGAIYAKTQWRCGNTGAITLGTTSITIEQFGAASMYSNGNGLSLTGTVFAVLLDTGSGLIVSGAGLKIDTSVVSRKYAASLTGDSTTSAFTVTHNLGTKDVVVSVRDSADNAVLVDWVATTTNTITVNFGAPPASGVIYRVVVNG